MQNQEKILIYIDILGFENRAHDIEDSLGIPASKIRKDFLTTINEKINLLKENEIIDAVSYGQRDDWILITNSIDQAFQVVKIVLNHNVFYPKFETIPLEIALGTGEFDQWAKLDDSNLIVEDGTIEFLKTKIVGDYHKWYRNNNFGRSPSHSFIVLTESFYSLLEFSEKSACTQITIDNKSFYSITSDKIVEKAQISLFLREIGFPNHNRYRMIEELFVPPFEYQNMEKTLEKEKLLLIIGTQEYGKTFSAVNLLWEYFKKGYKPKWIRGGEDLERNACRSMLENISTILSPKTIIYFEDPFGKIAYEKRESLEREIGTIIQEIQRINDTFVIITSREEVFKQFENELVQFGSITQSKLIFSIKNDSYDYQKRVKILLNWASFLSCKWLNDNDIKTRVITSLLDKSKLPTPLAIWNFTIASTNVTRNEDIFTIMEEKSQETSIAFAKEIEKMSQDKIIFLAFPFIANFSQKFVNLRYNDLIEELQIQNAGKFDSLLRWFANDKIDIVNGAITFSHPSYYESFVVILKNEKIVANASAINCINLVFSNLIESGGASAATIAKFISENFDLIADEYKIPWLIKLSDNNYAKKWVAITIIENYSILPSNIQDILFQIVSVKDSKSSRIISESLFKNFKALPQPIRQNLLLILSSNEHSMYSIAEILKKNFIITPKDLRNELIIKMARYPSNAIFVPEIIAENYSQCSPEIHGLLFRMAEDSNMAGCVAESIVNNYTHLPQPVRQLLFSLAKKPSAIRKIAEAIVCNYENLEQNVKNILTLFLVDQKTVGVVIVAIITHYDQIPTTLKKTFDSIPKKDLLIDELVEPLCNNFDKLPEDIQLLLLELLKRPELARRIAISISDNFEKIPEKYRNEILIKLANQHFSVNKVAKIIDNHLNVIPRDLVLQLMITLAKDPLSADYIVNMVNEKFSFFPLMHSIKLLKILSSQKNPSRIVAVIAIKNYHYSPEEFRGILKGLAKNDTTSLNIARVLSGSFSKLPEDVSFELLMKLGTQKTAAQGVVKILDVNFSKIPINDRNQILTNLLMNTSTAVFLPDIVSRRYNLLPENIRQALFSLSEREDTAGFVVLSISKYFNSLPEQVRKILLLLANKKSVSKEILVTINQNINKFPMDFQYELIAIASKNEEIAPDIAYILLKKYVFLDLRTKNILFELVKNEKIAVKIVSSIMKNYNAMPKEIKNLADDIMKNLNVD